MESGMIRPWSISDDWWTCWPFWLSRLLTISALKHLRWLMNLLAILIILPPDDFSPKAPDWLMDLWIIVWSLHWLFCTAHSTAWIITAREIAVNSMDSSGESLQLFCVGRANRLALGHQTFCYKTDWALLLQVVIQSVTWAEVLSVSSIKEDANPYSQMNWSLFERFGLHGIVVSTLLPSNLLKTGYNSPGHMLLLQPKKLSHCWRIVAGSVDCF